MEHGSTSISSDEQPKVPLSLLSEMSHGSSVESDSNHVEMVDMDDDSSHWPGGATTNDSVERPSNETLLTTAFLSFMAFTICQTVAAFIAGSEAMMGDSAAMFVDALTYLFNLVAERKKRRFDQEWQGTREQDPERARRIQERAKRKMSITLELVPPLISVMTLIVVIIFVLRKAIPVLILDNHRDRSQQGDPNLNVMLFFSTLNLGLDVMNVCCFARAKHLMGYQTMEDHEVYSGDMTKDNVARGARTPRAPQHYEIVGTTDLGSEEEVATEGASLVAGENGSSGLNGSEHRTLANGEQGSSNGDGSMNGNNHTALLESSSHEQSNGRSLQSLEMKQDESTDSCEDEKEGANLNMCSAYTHVFADTLRSIAVIIASVIAEFVDGVTPEEADATAAIVVSGLILLSLIPLFHGLVHTFWQLRAIVREEASDTMFPEQANRSSDLV